MSMPPPKLPKSWPKDVTFVTKPIYSDSITATQLKSPSPDPKLPVIKATEGPSVNVYIEAIHEPVHPAHGQSGLFSARAHPPDAFICFYLGFVHGPAATDPASNYDLSLDRELQISVDATNMGNEARFINDYRGVRLEGPNAEFRDCLADTGEDMLDRRIGVFALSPGKKGGKRVRGISKGEEILVSYGKGFWSHRKQEEQ